MFLPESETVHVSCTFTWDKPKAERLAESWSRYYPTTLGGPAYDAIGGEFEPGRYLRRGYTITSRGCNNRCWFCYVWKRDGNLRELEIKDGWNVLDDNLLACSDRHFENVVAMLRRQTKRAEFTGGLEAAKLRDFHVNLLADLKPKQMFFAYDTPDDREPLIVAGEKLLCAGFTRASHCLRCYVLVGFPGDTFSDAGLRLTECLTAGFTPMAMLYRGDDGKTIVEWRQFQRVWARPAIIHGEWQC